jgi:hypothetical protein
MALINADVPDDCRELWKKVVECVDVLNALCNMNVKVEGQHKMIGKLEVKSGSSLLTIEEHTQIGNLGQ